MDQVKIGLFIQERRKEVGLTQESLAEKLGITKNAVSKWERGLGLMDMSLLKPLSEILGVSVNDILAGEKIIEANLEQKSEENIIKLSELVELRSMKYGVIAMAIFSMVLVFISLFKDVSPSAVVSLLCAYNSVTFLSRHRISKDKSELVAGVLFLLAVICNTIAFIIC